MIKIPIINAKPNFDELISILKGLNEPRFVHFFEIAIDEEIKKFIIENYFNEKNISRVNIFTVDNLSFKEKKKASESYFKQLIYFYYKMGYSCFVDDEFGYSLFSLIGEAARDIKTKDTAIYSRGERQFVQGHNGLIKNWEDFLKFPWNKINDFLSWNNEHLEFMQENLPDGMKIIVAGAFFAWLQFWILGYEGLLFMIYDNPDLFEAILNKLGKIVYKMYDSSAQTDCVGALMTGDDLGFKTSTIISPECLRKFLFPWQKKFSMIAHKYGKTIWSHCCGFKESIMEDFIEYIKYDVLHSFEDEIFPVTEFKKRYGNRIALAGGVDMDKLCRLNETDLRSYLKKILNICMQGGRYVFGSGNTISNYVPIKNYLIMLEEGYKWI
jgi:uroporphyrinogen decarboxylase